MREPPVALPAAKKLCKKINSAARSNQAQKWPYEPNKKTVIFSTFKTPYMKNITLAFLSLITMGLYAQNGYWQQRVEYSIDATLNDKKATLTGKEKLTYFNNSPDDLKEIYFHLYWNAFKIGSHAMQHAREGGEEEALKKLDSLKKSDEGFIKITSVKVNGVAYTPIIFESIAQIKLNEVIKAGSSAIIEVDFESLIPSCINRSGKNNPAGTDFSMSQWYPKLCRYDKQGWHTDQYLGKEFAGTFGKYDVSITCSKDLVVAGTGVLQNKKYKETGWESTTGNPDIDKNKQTVWKFTADNVHDFAWAAEDTWYYSTLKIDDIDFHFFYHNNETYKPAWTTLILFWADAYEICKKEFGVYPYPQFSFIQAGEGYMEYPMCTLLEGGREDFFSTACHEFMHNFFYGIYGTDENLHHWMDEGLTSYAEARLSTAITNDFANPATEAGLIYKWVRTQFAEEPISTSANFFGAEYAYYNSAYYKGQLFPELIRYMIGDSVMRAGFANYYKNWKFKHPEPNDFVKNFEDVSGMELTWFQNYWLNTTKTVDLGIDSLTFKGSDAMLVFSNKGVPLPVEFTAEMKDGSKKYFYIPIDLTNNPKTNFMRPTTVLPYWSASEKKYRVLVKDLKKGTVKNITIDTDAFLPDMKPNNNVFIPQE